MFRHDLKALIVAAGAPSSRVLMTRKSTTPSGAGPWWTIVETTGGPVVMQHGRVSPPSYIRPAAQIVARAATAAAAEEAARLACGACRVRNVTINGTWYLQIDPVQDPPFDQGQDDKDRSRWGFNVIARCRPYPA